LTVTSLGCGSRSLDLRTPCIMGVINVTPDSFSDGGRTLRGGAADLGYVAELGAAMLEAGAAILDVGGESTRPGADPVDAATELARVMPVVERLTALDTIVSIDTSKPAVAREAVSAGCGMINDVRGLRAPGMLEVAADCDAAVVLMHMQGEPRSMQRKPVYTDVLKDVHRFLGDRVQACLAAGIDAARIALDPGFGFGKTLAHNLALLAGLEQVRVAGRPLVVGLSRKSMLGTLTGREVGERVVASAVAAALAAERGADILRVHDVAATRDALALVAALAEQERNEAGSA
jgi:dihydropteroate synthase